MIFSFKCDETSIYLQLDFYLQDRDNFVPDTNKAQLSYHDQHFAVIIILKFGWQWDKIWNMMSKIIGKMYMRPDVQTITRLWDPLWWRGNESGNKNRGNEKALGMDKNDTVFKRQWAIHSFDSSNSNEYNISAEYNKIEYIYIFAEF